MVLAVGEFEEVDASADRPVLNGSTITQSSSKVVGFLGWDGLSVSKPGFGEGLGPIPERPDRVNQIDRYRLDNTYCLPVVWRVRFPNHPGKFKDLREDMSLHLLFE